MIFPDNTESKIGFDKIRDMVAAECLSVMGRDHVQGLAFMTDVAAIRRECGLAAEFATLLQEEADFPVSFYFDVREPLRRIAVQGTFMEQGELWNLKRVMGTIADVVAFFEHRDASDMPLLKELSADVFTFPDLVRTCARVLDDEGNIRDTASPTLKEIRMRLRSLEGSVSATLGSVLRQAKGEGIVEPDVMPSVRDGRLVIPVSPANKRRLRGIVHDESATGKTVYVEPEALVELNNQIRECQGEERREIIKILIETANELRPRVREIEFSLGYLAQIDFIRAKARFALQTGALLPHVDDGPVVEWYGAVHPLLFLSHQRQGRTVVPLTIRLDEKGRILVISGPNAGGKSVCLKTVGLLQYMFQCGLLVPMGDNSHIGVFQSMFIDIGDEQSIENDLSTYSSHLGHMKVVERNCDSRSLILIDEFGSGTEPQIGGAIAVALLHRFNDSGAYGVITTHYNSLKNYAADTPGISNGAMMYDRQQMQPLFRLEIGNPGSSFAVDIARKIGLPEGVIKEAEEMVGSDYVNMDKYLQDIARDKRYWENKRQNIRLKSKHIDEAAQEYEAKLAQIDTERKQLLRQSKEEARQIVEQANAVVENTVRKIKEAQAEKNRMREARQEMENFKATLQDEQSAAIDRKIAQMREKEERKRQRRMERQGKADDPGTAEAPKRDVPQVGDRVRVAGMVNAGVLEKINGNNVVISMGLMRMDAKLDQIEKVSGGQAKKDLKRDLLATRTGNAADKIHERMLNFSREIDLRGMRGEEAVAATQYFIDDAMVLGVSQVRILHGTGTGALREVIRHYLSTVKGVSSYHDEHVQLGGAGITVVEFE